ncbi:hemolysin type calcium-binding protein [Rhizobium sullae]|uniref:Hemolysin type calcium-binding protein n=2 Tax=Rhizobium sullae TaxID=50338 RepID=A0A4R3Q303_RHISU|nr:hemolysin type calcium-binding protein [Rhizobium sullae]
MMATLTVNADYGLDMRGIDFGWLPYADSYTYGSTIFAAHFSDGTIEEFRGSGFDYDAYGVPTGGTIRSYAFFDNAYRVSYVDGIRIAVTSVVDAAETYTTSDDIAVIGRALAGNDVLRGGGIFDYLRGFAGNDTLYGNAGNDILVGEDGNDTIIGGSGKDRIDGGAGSDTASYAGASSGVVASLGNPGGNTQNAYGDTYVSVESLAGSSHADRLYGNAAANNLSGDAGNDYLSGSGGNDWLHGGSGADQLVGGSGADRFIFKAWADHSGDTIIDFTATQSDRIDMSKIDANQSIGGDQAFSFIGTAAFSGEAGELRFIKTASDTYIYGDVNGDASTDYTIHLDDAVTIWNSYFYL